MSGSGTGVNKQNIGLEANYFNVLNFLHTRPLQISLNKSQTVGRKAVVDVVVIKITYIYREKYIKMTGKTTTFVVRCDAVDVKHRHLLVVDVIKQTELPGVACGQ